MVEGQRSLAAKQIRAEDRICKQTLRVDEASTETAGCGPETPIISLRTIAVYHFRLHEMRCQCGFSKLREISARIYGLITLRICDVTVPHLSMVFLVSDHQVLLRRRLLIYIHLAKSGA